MTKYQLTKAQAEEVFFNCLCDNDIQIYDIDWKYNEAFYEQAKKNLMEKYKGDTPCYEDILMQMLRDGGKLGIIDFNYEDYNFIEGYKVFYVTLADIHEKINECPIDQLMNVLNEEYDVSDSDVILQTLFFGEIVYG